MIDQRRKLWKVTLKCAIHSLVTVKERICDLIYTIKQPVVYNENVVTALPEESSGEKIKSLAALHK